MTDMFNTWHNPEEYRKVGIMRMAPCHCTKSNKFKRNPLIKIGVPASHNPSYIAQKRDATKQKFICRRNILLFIKKKK